MRIYGWIFLGKRASTWFGLCGVVFTLAVFTIFAPSATAAGPHNPTTISPPYDEASFFSGCDLGRGSWQILKLESFADTSGAATSATHIKTGDDILAKGSKSCSAFALVTSSFRVRKGASPTNAIFNIRLKEASAFKTLIADGFSKVVLVGFVEDFRASPSTRNSVARIVVDSAPETTPPDTLMDTDLTLKVPVEPSGRQGSLQATLQVIALSQLGFGPSETSGEASAIVDALLTSISIGYIPL